LLSQAVANECGSWNDVSLWEMSLMDHELAIYVADAGSVSKGNFHWVSSCDIEKLLV
jgi:hypothetical protein